ncbi:Zinc finger protein rsv1 [Grifola frondosa]|uniref:Zinc finger protein rsv1 n=1 Tax=Grifola frondosa TaxID=5627 RepID=A0A1C7LMI4_GRIFR|nr:Zinc finger protein rsv1 [Grifola frondosa]
MPPPSPISLPSIQDMYPDKYFNNMVVEHNYNDVSNTLHVDKTQPRRFHYDFRRRFLSRPESTETTSGTAENVTGVMHTRRGLPAPHHHDPPHIVQRSSTATTRSHVPAPLTPFTAGKYKDGPSEKSPPSTPDSDLVDDGKKHTCPLCQRTFNRPSSLSTHMNSHTGAQPFECLFPNCKRRFSVRSNMLRHYRTHDLPQTHPGPFFQSAVSSGPLPPDYHYTAEQLQLFFAVGSCPASTHHDVAGGSHIRPSVEISRPFGRASLQEASPETADGNHAQNGSFSARSCSQSSHTYSSFPLRPAFS